MIFTGLYQLGDSLNCDTGAKFEFKRSIRGSYNPRGAICTVYVIRGHLLLQQLHNIAMHADRVCGWLSSRNILQSLQTSNHDYLGSLRMVNIPCNGYNFKILLLDKVQKCHIHMTVVWQSTFPQMADLFASPKQRSHNPSKHRHAISTSKRWEL